MGNCGKAGAHVCQLVVSHVDLFCRTGRTEMAFVALRLAFLLPSQLFWHLSKGCGGVFVPFADDSMSGVSASDVNERLCALELRVQQQEDEVTVMKAALADVLRRLASSEDGKKPRGGKGTLLYLAWSGRAGGRTDVLSP